MNDTKQAVVTYFLDFHRAERSTDRYSISLTEEEAKQVEDMGKDDLEDFIVERGDRWMASKSWVTDTDGLTDEVVLHVQPKGGVCSSTVLYADMDCPEEFDELPDMEANTRSVGYPVESGAASITISLSNGHIKINHGCDHTLLAELKDAPKGTWDKLWARFEQLDFKRPEELAKMRGYK